MIWALLVQLADILVLFFFGWLVAFMLEPAVAMLQERHGLRRQVAVAIVYLGLLALLVGVAFWLVPAVAAQLVLIVQQWPLYVDNVTLYSAQLHEGMLSRGFYPYPAILGGYQDMAGRRGTVSAP